MQNNNSLSGITSLLFPIKEEREDFCTSYLCAGLRYALLFANELAQHLDSDFGVAITAFNTPKGSGLFFHNEVDRRAVKVMSHPIAGGVMVFVGSSDDFEFPSRLASEKLQAICFEEEDIAKYARAIAPHFSAANPPVCAESLVMG